MKLLKMITATCVLLYVSAADTYAVRGDMSSPVRYVATEPPTTAAGFEPDTSGGSITHGRPADHRKRDGIEAYVTSDDDGKALIIRIAIPGASTTLTVIALAAAIAAGTLLYRRHNRAVKQPDDDTCTCAATVPTHDCNCNAAPTQPQSKPEPERHTAARMSAANPQPAQAAATAEYAETAAATGSGDTCHDPHAEQPATDSPAYAGPHTDDGFDPAIHVSGNDRYMIRRLDEFIAQHISEVDLTVNDLATAVYMSRSNLFRRLKALYGVTPNEYLRNKRLNHAAELLKQNRYNISDISFMVGFSSPSYFASCFKKYFGTLPKHYVREE